MNKYLKLSLVFAAIIGVIVALSQIGTIFPGQAPNPNSDSRYDEISKEIGKCWNDKNQWNEDSYNYCMNKINDYYRKSYIKKKDYHLLFSRVNAEAVNTINAFYDAEMQKSGCNDSDIEKNKNGLDYISGYKNPYDDDYDFSKDERVIKAHYMYEQYKGIINFCERDFIVEAKIYNGCTWTPFSYYNDQWDSPKSSLEQGEYYRSHFSKIDKVKNAWASYYGKINQSKNNYYTDMAILIKGHFDKRYTNKKIDENQKELKDDYHSLNEINKNLKSSYNDVKNAYNYIQNNYVKIVSIINDYDYKMKNSGSRKYDKYSEDKENYVKTIKNTNKDNEKVKYNIDALINDFETNTKEMNKLIERIDKHQSNLDEYESDLRNVNNRFKAESSFGTLDQYYDGKVDDITKLSNDLPMIHKENGKYVSNDSYISSLKEYSEQLTEIINYINGL